MVVRDLAQDVGVSCLVMKYTCNQNLKNATHYIYPAMFCVACFHFCMRHSDGDASRSRNIETKRVFLKMYSGGYRGGTPPPLEPEYEIINV